MANQPNNIEHIDSVRSSIRKCFADLGSFDEADIDAAVELITIKAYKKGEHLLREGEVSAKSYSIVSGCVRQYYLVDGEEKTTFFYTEGQSIFSPNSSSERIPAKYYLSCVEYTTLSIMSLENQKEMYKRFPMLESMSRMSLQEELNNYQEMLATYITTNPEERYLNLLKFRPELLNRVPQYQLASYLGVTPESLSRIRKRIFIK
ncbi:Crp/Fnr family transcriptional regulator [Maribacter algarum]|uniref:Crp/Fnr family transcriptional regulator n=1 Tax=Maribacter algarum (ex Zhang et al. 2020) TaxID=2578118 RepID=UPI001BB20CE9|nr:Crp/Fnr family transcriptional regulator [Maribacter algarum]